MEKLKQIMGCLRDKSFMAQNSKGRLLPEKNEMELYGCIEKEDPFWVDIQKILNSKSFRRLAGKTQVFSLSKNVLIRNRLIHSLEVKSISETIARFLGLNVNLVSAIALVHDIGHTPFGHLGESVLSKLTNNEFRHERFGVILAQKIERKGYGLNLSIEVLEGMLEHSRGGGSLELKKNLPLEYMVVMLADKIAYTFSDLSDALRLDRIKRSNIPEEVFLLGEDQRAQVNSCITAICLESSQEKTISFSKSKEAQYFNKAREWMYDNLYYRLDKESLKKTLSQEISEAYFFIKGGWIGSKTDPAAVIATMTDEEVLAISKIAKKEAVVEDLGGLRKLGFYEIIRYCHRYDYSSKEAIENYLKKV
jgi:dGTPase